MTRSTFMRQSSGRRTGKGPHIELGKLSDLPAGVPGPTRPVANRNASGQFVSGDGTRQLAREGGKALAVERQLASLLSLSELPDEHPATPYMRLTRAFYDDYLIQLAASVGGGEVGPGPASIASSAAVQLGASRWLSDRGLEKSDTKLLLEASRLADASRQNLLAAHSLAALEASARPRGRKGMSLADQVAGSIPKRTS